MWNNKIRSGIDVSKLSNHNADQLNSGIWNPFYRNQLSVYFRIHFNGWQVIFMLIFGWLIKVKRDELEVTWRELETTLQNMIGNR